MIDVLRLVLSLLLLTAPPCALGKPSCKEEEFPTGAMCCPKCWPGFRVQEACGELRTTVCEPCTRGTYTPHLNALRECLPCRVCDPGLGQVTSRKCSTWTNTICGCWRGHFCVRQDGASCVQCRPHSVCRPGQRLQVTGTEWQDTLCEDCHPGTFSAGGTQAACTPWTRCSGPLAWDQQLRRDMLPLGPRHHHHHQCQRHPRHRCHFCAPCAHVHQEQKVTW